MLNYICIAICTVVLTSPAENVKKMFVGKWQVYKTDIIQPTLEEELEKAVIEVITSYEYEFKSNGVLIYNDFVIKNAKGNWAVTDSILKYTYNFDNPMYVEGYPDQEPQTISHDFEVKVMSLNQTEMTWFVEEDTDQFIFYLRKQ